MCTYPPALFAFGCLSAACQRLLAANGGSQAMGNKEPSQHQGFLVPGPAPGYHTVAVVGCSCPQGWGQSPQEQPLCVLIDGKGLQKRPAWPIALLFFSPLSLIQEQHHPLLQTLLQGILLSRTPPEGLPAGQAYLAKVLFFKWSSECSCKPQGAARRKAAT